MRVLLFGLVATGLTGVATSAVPAASAPQGVTALPRCTQAVLGKYIGKHQSAGLARQMRHATGAKSVRWVPVGTMVSMLYQYDRLTVRLGPDRRVTQASCN